MKEMGEVRARLTQENAKNMVTAKLKYIEFIHKANEEYRDMARRAQERQHRQ